jgi:hypothetical protein
MKTTTKIHTNEQMRKFILTDSELKEALKDFPTNEPNLDFMNLCRTIYQIRCIANHTQYNETLLSRMTEKLISQIATVLYRNTFQCKVDVNTPEVCITLKMYPKVTTDDLIRFVNKVFGND